MRTHRFAPASLLFGLLFAGLGLAFFVGDPNVWRIDWSWFWPLALVVGGLAVLASARPQHTEPEQRDEPQLDDESSDGPVL